MTDRHFNASELAAITGLPRPQLNLLLSRNDIYHYGLPVTRVPVGRRQQAVWALPDLAPWFLFARLLEGGIAPATASAVVRLVRRGFEEHAPLDPPRYAVVDLMAAPVLTCAAWTEDAEGLVGSVGMASYVIDVYAITKAVKEAVDLLPALAAAAGRRLGKMPKAMQEEVPK